MIKDCKTCGIKFTSRPSRKNPYCSRSCYAESLKIPAEERFWQRVDKTETCWLWTGDKYPTGYGRIKVNGKFKSTHRFSYELNVGEIPKGEGHHGICVCHKCDIKSCVRPDHLFLGTMMDNMHDMIRKGRKIYTHDRNFKYLKGKL